MKLAGSRKTPLRRSQRNSLTGIAAMLLLSFAIFAAPVVLAAKNKKDKSKSADVSKALKGLPVQDLSDDEAIMQAFNRLGFGARPGDLERVKQMGLQAWIDRQLHPESIDDSALDARLDRFSTLKMSSARLLEEFPQPQVAARREGITVEEYRKQQQERLKQVAQATQTDMQAGPQNDMQKADAQGLPNFETGAMDGNDPGKQKGGGKGQDGFAGNMFNYQEIRTPQRIVAELSMAKVTRAVYSERQLNEMMVDFWYNHFNVFAAKGDDRWLITAYERDAIRPHAMGKFRDLLEATAKSPAMLFYLDNWLSADPVAWQKLQQEQQQRRQMRQQRFGGPFGRPRFPQGQGGPNANPNDPNAKGKRMERGLNENYGRELMELHTLGVDGGYTQDDVINVAKAFTGWTIREPRRDPEFFFDERIHNTGKKTVLGHAIHGGGMKDGEEVLDLLARDPHTAHHISFELAQRFVSDNPPAGLVDRMAQTFQKSDGDIREVLRAMIYSPEFWSRDVYRAKIKTPFELVVSATRAVGADVDVPFLLVQWTTRIGQPLYQCEPPTGYSAKAEAWVNTGALLNRMNFSLALTANRLRGAQVEIEPLLGGQAAADPHATLDHAIHVLLGGQVSPQTRETLEKQLTDPQILQASLDDPVKQVNAAMIAGLVLGSPEFQRR
ncbi:MAG: DUF1800 domain-containing protein [Acidobacteriia bacterium]|nr:DUF1800 domain-containing protein [Terriglobia bacterium]